jgi:hypothetical protein
MTGISGAPGLPGSHLGVSETGHEWKGKWAHIDGWIEGVWDQWLAKLRVWATETIYDWTAGFSAEVGHLAVLIGAALVVIFGIVGAAKTDSFRIFLISLAAVIGLLMAQYTAVKFIRAAAQLIRSTPTELATPAFPDCVVLISGVEGVVLIVTGIVTALQTEMLTWLWPFLIAGLALVALAWVSLNPAVANITVTAGTSAAGEAIAVLGYFAKIVLKLVPVLFGMVAVIGLIQLLLAPTVIHSQGIEMAGMQAGTAYLYILAGALIPLVVYLLFLGVYLALDLANAVLRTCHRYLGQPHF